MIKIPAAIIKMVLKLVGKVLIFYYFSCIPNGYVTNLFDGIQMRKFPDSNPSVNWECGLIN